MSLMNSQHYAALSEISSKLSADSLILDELMRNTDGLGKNDRIAFKKASIRIKSNIDSIQRLISLARTSQQDLVGNTNLLEIISNLSSFYLQSGLKIYTPRIMPLPDIELPKSVADCSIRVIINFIRTAQPLIKSIELNTYKSGKYVHMHSIIPKAHDIALGKLSVIDYLQRVLREYDSDFDLLVRGSNLKISFKFKLASQTELVYNKI